MTKDGRFLIQIAIAVVAALLFALLLHAEWFHTFTKAHSAIRAMVGIFTFPAIIMAYAIGGHAASTEEFAIGLVVQFLAMLWMAHLLKRAYLKLEASMT
jgi:hypothetical protein